MHRRMPKRSVQNDGWNTSREAKKQLQVKKWSLFTQAVNMWDCYCDLLLVFADVLPPCLHQTLKFEHYSIEQQHILFIHLTVNSFCSQQVRYTPPIPTPPHSPSAHLSAGDWSLLLSIDQKSVIKEPVCGPRSLILLLTHSYAAISRGLNLNMDLKVVLVKTSAHLQLRWLFPGFERALRGQHCCVAVC